MAERNNNVLLSTYSNEVLGSDMRTYEISYSDRETLPDQLDKLAAELGITSEQLIKRFIDSGMLEYEMPTAVKQPVESLDDNFINAGVLKPE